MEVGGMIGRVLAVAALVLAGGSQAFAADPAGVCAEAQAFSTARNGVSVLVLKDGKTVCEGYAGAGGPDRGWEIWSGTKSFNGMILAAAVQDGLITLDEKVADTLPAWRDDPKKAKVTIRQLLSLTSGLQTSVGRAPDYAGAVAAAVTAEPGTRFDYGAEPFQVFGAVMTAKLKAARTGDADVLAYLERRILGPAGVRWADWRRSPSGDALLPQGSSFTAREWARFGEFVRGGAIKDGRPLVDPATFQAQFEGTGVNPAYGLTWWLARPGGFGPRNAPVDFSDNADALPADLRMAAGAGNQRLYIVPSCGLTVVRQASFTLRTARSGPRWSDYAFLAPIIKAWC
jgi:CubicO group peptidase (beta-lactamase class C family)